MAIATGSHGSQIAGAEWHSNRGNPGLRRMAVGRRCHLGKAEVGQCRACSSATCSVRRRCVLGCGDGCLVGVASRRMHGNQGLWLVGVVNHSISSSHGSRGRRCKAGVVVRCITAHGNRGLWPAGVANRITAHGNRGRCKAGVVNRITGHGNRGPCRSQGQRLRAMRAMRCVMRALGLVGARWGQAGVGQTECRAPRIMRQGNRGRR